MLWSGGIRTQADISALRQSMRGGVVVGTRGFYRGTRRGAGLSAMGALLHYVPVRAWRLRLVYQNWYNPATTTREVVNTNAVTLKAALEDSALNIYPVNFGGNRTIVMQPGAIVISDPVDIDVAAGGWVRSRTFMAVSAGEQVPLATKPILSYAAGERNLVTPADACDTAYASWGTSDEATTCGPVALLGETEGMRVASLALVGDSILGGSGDWETLGDGVNVSGWVRRLCLNDVSFIQTGCAGDRLEYVTPNTGHGLRGVLAGWCSHVLLALGANDLAAGANLAAMQARWLEACQQFQRRGCQIISCTVTPNTTSTDCWRTTANQTPYAFEATRVQFNDWLRTRPCGEVACWDVADQCESARNSGRWHVGVTAVSGSALGAHTTTRVYDTSRSWTVGQWNGLVIVMTSGAQANLPRLVTSTNPTYVSHPGLPGAPVDGDGYVIGEFPTTDGIHPAQWVHQRIATSFRAAGLHTALRVA